MTIAIIEIEGIEYTDIPAFSEKIRMGIKFTIKKTNVIEKIIEYFNLCFIFSPSPCSLHYVFVGM